MIVRTTAQNLSCDLASVSSAFPSCIQAKKTRRMFSDLSHLAYLYFSLCTSGTRPRTITTRIFGISKQCLSWGSVEYNGSGLHTLQAIYSTYWFYFSIDCFYFESGRFSPTSLCLFVWSCLTYWWIYCCNLYWVFHRGNTVYLGWHSNVALWIWKLHVKPLQSVLI